MGRHSNPSPKSMNALPAGQHDVDTLVASGRRVVEVERGALAALQERIGPEFAQACELLLACRGRVVCIGMGKSGHIATKIAATMASTGTPAFFVHPGEASHGDLGMVTDSDVVLMLSNSGESEEILMIVPVLAIAGSLGRKKAVPPSLGTFPVTTPLFATLLVGVILIVGALTFFPVLSLGPIVEHLLMLSGRTF